MRRVRQETTSVYRAAFASYSDSIFTLFQLKPVGDVIPNISIWVDVWSELSRGRAKSCPGNAKKEHRLTLLVYRKVSPRHSVRLSSSTLAVKSEQVEGEILSVKSCFEIEYDCLNKGKQYLVRVSSRNNNEGINRRLFKIPELSQSFPNLTFIYLFK